jgi:hypothetical protein
MIGYLKRLAVENLASPYALAAVSYSIFLIGWLFPPDLYTSYINEPDILFLDPLTFIFFTLCVIAFLVGVRASRFLGISRATAQSLRVSPRVPVVVFLGTPLIVSTILCAIFILLLGAKINFLALLASQQGTEIKLASEAGMLSVGGKWAVSFPFLMGTLWWASFRSNQLKIQGFTRRMYWPLYLTGFVVAVLTCVATVDRTSLMPLMLGAFIIYLYNKSKSEKVALGKIAANVVIGFVGALCGFSLLQFLRGATAMNLIIRSQLGYTIVSYNRLAALLSGTMHYAYEGRGVYLVSYLLKDSTLTTALDVRNFLDWPSQFVLWRSEFSSTSLAGLSPSYIWSGVFGYIYSDIGWWTPLYMLLTGVLAGYLWSRFRAAGAIGIVLYVWIGFWILFWVGSNILLDNRFVSISECGIALAVYERLLANRIYEC